MALPDLKSIILQTPQVTPPAPFDFGITLAQPDREKFAMEFGAEIRRTLQARRSGAAAGYKWYGDVVDAASTTVTRVTDPGSGRPLMKSWEDEIQDFWARYELLPPDRTPPFDGAANYRTPLTKWIVDAILARIIAGLATVRPIYRVEAAHSMADIEQAGKVEEFLDYVLEHELNFVQWLDDALLQAAVEGAAIGYLTWNAGSPQHQLAEVSQEQTAPVMDETGQPVTDMFGQPVQKQTTMSSIQEVGDVTEEKPYLALVPLTDFLVADPRRKDLNDQPWMGHRTRLYRAELSQLRGKPGYIDEELNNLLDGAGNASTDPSIDKAEQGVQQRVGIATGATSGSAALPSMRMLNYWDIWTIIAWYDWDQDGKPERVVAEIAMPQARLIRLIKYPYLHNRPFYIPISLLPRSNSFYPRSLVGDLRMTQDEVDAIHNQRTDATSVAISALFMFLYDEQAGFDPSRVRMGLGESIKVTGDINHIQTLAKSFRGVNPPGMDIENLLIDFARQLSGIHEMQTGGAAGARTTAFEVGAVLQEGNVKFRRMIERVSVSMAEIAYQVIALYQQHANRIESKVYKVLDDPNNPFRTMDMGDLAGRWNYRVHGMAIASQRDLDAKKAMQMMELVEKSTVLQKFIGADPRRLYHLVRVFLDKLGWPVEDLIGKETEIPGLMGAQADQAAQAQQQAGDAVQPDVQKMVEQIQGRMGGGSVTANRVAAAEANTPGAQAGQAGADTVAAGTGQ